MSTPYITLDHRQWKDLHNALCRAEQEAGHLFSVLKDGGAGLEALKSVRDALAPAYAQDDAAFTRKHEYFEGIKTTYGFRSIWSLYDQTDVGSFHDAHPFVGATHVLYDCHWGTVPGPDIVIGGDTWLDLYSAADIAIKQSGDDHHVYIEAFQPSQDKPGRLVLSTGS